MVPTSQPSLYVTRDDRPSSTRLTAGDVVVLVTLAGLSFGLYGTLAFRLAQGAYLDYYNFAFDFDPVRTVDALTSTPPDFLNVKHPLVVLLRPLTWPLLQAGLTGKECASLVLAGFGAATATLCYAFLRKTAIDRPIAAALALLFIVSGTQIFTSIIAETYGIAGFSLALTWVIAQARLADPGRFRRLRYLAGVLTFGTTITNTAQTFIAEMLVAWRWEGFLKAIYRCVLFGLILAIPVVILSVAVWHHALREELNDPILALKHVFWMRTKGDRTGVGQVLLTFFTFSFVSPRYTWLTLPEGINMRDFREYSFSLAGQIAAPLWLAFCTVGSVAAFCHRRNRMISVGLGAALVSNLVFHLDFQFRGSLYVYAAHMHFLIFALGCGLAPLLRFARPSGKVYTGLVLLMVLLTAADNLPIANAFVTDFQQVQATCAPPCQDKVGQ
jgi:hypothetical protein